MRGFYRVVIIFSVVFLYSINVIPNKFRTYVHSLISRAPGSACFSFPSREEAFDDYYTMKTNGRVHVSGRVQGDEQEFGPLSDAIM